MATSRSRTGDVDRATSHGDILQTDGEVGHACQRHEPNSRPMSGASGDPCVIGRGRGADSASGSRSRSIARLVTDLRGCSSRAITRRGGRLGCEWSTPRELVRGRSVRSLTRERSEVGSAPRGSSEPPPDRMTRLPPTAGPQGTSGRRPLQSRGSGCRLAPGGALRKEGWSAPPRRVRGARFVRRASASEICP